MSDKTSSDFKKGQGIRHNSGKVDYSLIPLCTLEEEARVWMKGVEKYAKNNWMLGMSWNAVFASMMRHMAAWQAGQDIDEESGLPHIAHAMCNLRMLMLYSKTYKEGDDRPKQWIGEYSSSKSEVKDQASESSSEKEKPVEKTESAQERQERIFKEDLDKIIKKIKEGEVEVQGGLRPPPEKLPSIYPNFPTYPIYPYNPPGKEFYVEPWYSNPIICNHPTVVEANPFEWKSYWGVNESNKT